MANSYMEYYTTMRLNELHHTTEWMMLRNIRLADKSQTQESTCFKNPLKSCSKKGKENLSFSLAGGPSWRRK